MSCKRLLTLNNSIGIRACNYPLPLKKQLIMLMEDTLNRFKSVIRYDYTLHDMACIGFARKQLYITNYNIDYVDIMK